MLWALIAGVTAGGLIISAFVAAGLARWASRPLTALAGAAGQLGGGRAGHAGAGRVRPARGPPPGGSVQHDGRAAAGPGAWASVDDGRGIAPGAHAASRTAAAAGPAGPGRRRADRRGAGRRAGGDRPPGPPGQRAARRRQGRERHRRPVDIDVSAVLADRAAAWRPAAEERGITLTADCRAGLSPREPATVTWSRYWTICWPTRWTRCPRRHADPHRQPRPAGARRRVSLGGGSSDDHGGRQRPRDDRSAAAHRVPPVRHRLGLAARAWAWPSSTGWLPPMAALWRCPIARRRADRHCRVAPVPRAGEFPQVISFAVPRHPEKLTGSERFLNWSGVTRRAG